MQLVKYYSNFQYFHVLLYIHFLLLVELKHWLADMAFLPLSTLAVALQHLDIQSESKVFFFFFFVFFYQTFLHLIKRISTFHCACQSENFD